MKRCPWRKGSPRLARPAEQVLGQIAGIEHTFSVDSDSTRTLGSGARVVDRGQLRIAMAWSDPPSLAGSGGTLINDLDRRGLLDETVIALATEFGRTPRINDDDGRDHFPRAFSGFLAGGGIKGGVAYGKTDAGGENVIEGKILPPDFNATIGYALGLPLDQIIYSPSKRPFTLADKGQPIMDLFA